MFVNLLCLTVLLKKTSQHTHPSHPVDFLRHTGVSSTLAFSTSSVPSLPPGNGVLPYASSWVDSLRFSDNKTILDQLAHILARVRVGDHVGLIWVQPDFVLATLHDSGRQPLLQLKTGKLRCIRKTSVCYLSHVFLKKMLTFGSL